MAGISRAVRPGGELDVGCVGVVGESLIGCFVLRPPCRDSPASQLLVDASNDATLSVAPRQGHPRRPPAVPVAPSQNISSSPGNDAVCDRCFLQGNEREKLHTAQLCNIAQYPHFSEITVLSYFAQHIALGAAIFFHPQEFFFITSEIDDAAFLSESNIGAKLKYRARQLVWINPKDKMNFFLGRYPGTVVAYVHSNSSQVYNLNIFE